MKIPTEFERAGLKQAARLWRALPPATRRTLGDPAVRDALNETYLQAMKIYDDVRDKNAAPVGRRIARDAKLQDNVAHLVRSATRAVDRSRTSTRRRLPRRLLWLAALAGAGVAIARLVNRPACVGKTPDITVQAAPVKNVERSVANK
jgi:hypothetical protein